MAIAIVFKKDSQTSQESIFFGSVKVNNKTTASQGMVLLQSFKTDSKDYAIAVKEARRDMTRWCDLRGKRMDHLTAQNYTHHATLRFSMSLAVKSSSSVTFLTRRESQFVLSQVLPYPIKI